MTDFNLDLDFLKIIVFDEKYAKFKKFDTKYLDKKLDEKDFGKYFWSLKSLLVFYCRNLKWHYKKQGKILYLPVQILKQAQKDKLINDADIWLKYTAEMNAFINIEDKHLRKEAMIKILDNYRHKTDLMLEYMRCEEKRKICCQNKKIFDEITISNLSMAEKTPTYSHEEINITERSYKILLDFFKANPEIKKVWIHGSRAKGTSLPGSDLDLIIDCEFSAWEKIQTDFTKLLIPYFIDATNLHNNERTAFIKCAMYLGTKKIYDKKDFQIFWDDNKSLNSASIKIDISKLI